MDIARYFIEKQVTSWMVTLILLVGGAIAFMGLGRLEDPEFSIKQVNIITAYPGATPEQVEDEVTYLLEKEMQNLPYVKTITSTSNAGVSKLEVEMKDTTPGDTLGQVWDEVRKKIKDVEAQLPSGAGTPVVVDDFSDVYGILYALTSENLNDFEYRELKTVASDLSKQLALVDGVSKVLISGVQAEQVLIEIPRKNLIAMGIPIGQIAGLLGEQNVVSNSGFVNVGEEVIRLTPTGEFNSLDELGLLTIPSAQTGQTVKLKDIATISRSYVDPSSHIIHFNGKSAVTLGVSFLPGVNVVEVSKRVKAKLEESMFFVPQGVDIDTVYFQGSEVESSVNGFLSSLLQAVVIVIVVLLIFMGLKSGILIGLILAITIFGTFIVMNMMGITLQRISLGGLVIALGMLVDNAIVVTEGILMGLKEGKTRLQAASAVVKQTQWPLLGATIIAITAFAPIGLSPDSIGEFVGSLFWVLLISLAISWFTAVSLTPFFCSLLFKEEVVNENEDAVDPYRGFIFTIYKGILHKAMRFRWLTVAMLLIALIVTGYGFTKVKQAFFPASAAPMFFVDVRYPIANQIEVTAEKIRLLEERLTADDRVDYVTTTVGEGLPRFILTYSSVESGSGSAQMLVRLHKREDIDDLIQDIDAYMSKEQPEAHAALLKLQLGPGGDKLAWRISGPDAAVLRDIAEQIKDIWRTEPNISGIRDDWKAPVKVLQPIFNAEKASELGISKQAYDKALLTQLQGQTVGTFRDGNKLLPIVMKVPKSERESVDQLKDVQIYTNGVYVYLTEVTEKFKTIWQDPSIKRRDRQRTITVIADPHINSPLNTNQLFTKTRSSIEAIDLPPGYKLEIGGEYEDSASAQENMVRLLPLGYLFMFIITILLFNSVKETLIVWLCVPLMIIGISSGLLLLDVAFGFMGFLGFLSLSGMVVKNGIVLIDQVNVEIDKGKDHFSAVFDAAVSRLRPVFMAALTTILGLAPLFFDPFFEDMAVVISFGLGFATILTLVAVPVFYVIFFGGKRSSCEVIGFLKF